MVTTIASVTETLHLLGFRRNDQIDFIKWIFIGAVEIQNIEIGDFCRLKERIENYCDLPMDFAESCLTYLAENSVSTLLQLSTATSQFIALMGERNSKLFSSKSCRGWEGIVL